MRSLHCAAYIAVKVIALGGLKSSAFRTCQDYLCESLHIREMMKSEPGAFEGLDPFETLVFAQHYGVPTRLLDVAYNPLVALFFACESSFDTEDEPTNGAVFSFGPVPIFNGYDPSVLIISDYVCNIKRGNDWNDALAERLLLSARKRLKYSNVTLETIRDIMSCALCKKVVEYLWIQNEK